MLGIYALAESVLVAAISQHINAQEYIKMTELESAIAEIERDLEVERCEAALPRLLALAEGDNPTRTYLYLLCARCYFVARRNAQMEEMLQKARDTAAVGPLESKVRLAINEASLLTSAMRLSESAAKLEFALMHLDEVPKEMRALGFAIRGRNDALLGAYSEAIEYSQEAIALSSKQSSSSAFAHGTMALVFQTMGRLDESEQYGLEQIRILTERGSKNVAGLYAFLADSASSRQDWQRATEYQGLAVSTMQSTAGGASLRHMVLFWMANSELELGNYDKAVEYVEEGLSLSRGVANQATLINAQVLLGHIRLRKGEPELALVVLHASLAEEEQLGDIQRMNLYKALAETYRALDRKAEAFDICWKLWELQIDFDGRTREALLRYHRSLEQKIHEQKTAILNLKATQMERELALTATQLAAQTDLLGRFRDDLREIVRDTDEPNSAIRKVKDKLKALPCEQIDWTKFDAQFTSVHPEFKSKLEEKHPDLTRSEVKICSLSRLKLTSEEIARLLCLSSRSVETHRLNIRRKLGLKTEQNLGAYLAGL
jgi:DNA-binding CsgD family transcriptional regulator/tetratricopeptide (TPR) repeat protein